jgi:hypothetical protein
MSWRGQGERLAVGERPGRKRLISGGGWFLALVVRFSAGRLHFNKVKKFIVVNCMDLYMDEKVREVSR